MEDEISYALIKAYERGRTEERYRCLAICDNRAIYSSTEKVGNLRTNINQIAYQIRFPALKAW